MIFLKRLLLHWRIPKPHPRSVRLQHQHPSLVECLLSHLRSPWLPNPLQHHCIHGPVHLRWCGGSVGQLNRSDWPDARHGVSIWVCNWHICLWVVLLPHRQVRLCLHGYVLEVKEKSQGALQWDGKRALDPPWPTSSVYELIIKS